MEDTSQRAQKHLAPESRLKSDWPARRVYDRFLSSQLFYLEDQSDRQVARITYVSGSGVGYVLDLRPGAPEVLSTIAVAACIIADNAFVFTTFGEWRRSLAQRTTAPATSRYPAAWKGEVAHGRQ